MTQKHYIFVDFENVQNVDLGLIADKPVTVILVTGSQQSRVSFEFTKQLLRHSAQVRLIESAVKGHNALDFVLASEVGAQSVADPGGAFYIISRDKGFDALVAYLHSQGRHIERYENLAKTPVLMPAKATAPAPAKATAAAPARPRARAAKKAVGKPSAPPSERCLTKLSERFADAPKNRPKTEKALLALIGNLCGPNLAVSQVKAVVAKLVETGVLIVSAGGAVAYQ